MSTIRQAGFATTLLCAALLASILAGSAAAATVVNGNFESGDLRGWHVKRQTFAGNWFAYSGTGAPIGNKPKSKPVQAPPQGRYAAITDEAARESLILYQDVSLPSGITETLSLLAYYDSYKPIAIPTPNTLAAEYEALGGQANQQFRIDVISPTAPLDSLDPADILRTVFQTRQSGPTKMSPTRLTADLGAFAGQTVRLRMATVATEEVLNAGVDDVSISAGSGAGGPGSGAVKGGSGKRGKGGFRIARVKANRRNGTAVLFVRVPGAGLVTVSDANAGRRGQRAHRSRARRHRRSSRGKVRAVTAKARGAGVLRIRLKPTRLGRGILKRRHRLRTRVKAVYTPASGARRVARAVVTLKLRRLLAYTAN